MRSRLEWSAVSPEIAKAYEQRNTVALSQMKGTSKLTKAVEVQHFPTICHIH